MKPMNEKELFDNYWKSINKFSAIESITLSKNYNSSEFQLYGNRLALKITEMLAEFGNFEFKDSSIVEIGCGIGRFIVPLSKEFKFVYGIDISEDIILECKKYCDQFEIKNYNVFKNDGRKLEMFESASEEYCFSSGVFQHIVDFSCIVDYIKEAIRILKVGGIFLFQFQAVWSDDIGKGRHGAAIKAYKLDKELFGLPYEIKEISYDPYDPRRQFIVILEKTEKTTIGKFSDFKIKPKLFRTACVDLSDKNSQTYKDWMEFLNKPNSRKRVTFLDK